VFRGVAFRQFLRSDFSWLLLLIVVFIVTTRWLSWQDGIAAVGGNDVHSYQLLAEAAPGFPDTVVGSAYTDRYLVHWFVGWFSAATGLALTSTYRLIWAVVFCAIIVTTCACLRRLGVQGWPRRLCLALVVLNPYALRYYAIVPGYLADLVFQAGLVLALLGTISRRYLMVVAGVLLAVPGRQTIIIVAPVLAIWLILDGRGLQRARARQTTAMLLVLLPFAVLTAVRRLTAPFTHTFSPRFPDDTVLPLIANLPGSATVLADHLLRVLAPLMVTLSMLVALLVVHLHRRKSPPLAAPMTAFAAFAVVCQPLGIGPTFPGFAGNEPRLSALGLIPLVLCLGVLLNSIGPRRWKTAHVWGLMLVVVVASLHHIYTAIGPATVGQFIVVQGAASAGAVLLLLTAERAESPENANQPEGNPSIMGDRSRSRL
jgi:hypothetical protein